jgi:hypothetical protein
MCRLKDRGQFLAQLVGLFQMGVALLETTQQVT